MYMTAEDWEVIEHNFNLYQKLEQKLSKRKSGLLFDFLMNQETKWPEDKPLDVVQYHDSLGNPHIVNAWAPKKPWVKDFLMFCIGLS